MRNGGINKDGKDINVLVTKNDNYIRGLKIILKNSCTSDSNTVVENYQVELLEPTKGPIAVW